MRSLLLGAWQLAGPGSALSCLCRFCLRGSVVAMVSETCRTHRGLWRAFSWGPGVSARPEEGHGVEGVTSQVASLESCCIQQSLHFWCPEMGAHALCMHFTMTNVSKWILGAAMEWCEIEVKPLGQDLRSILTTSASSRTREKARSLWRPLFALLPPP